MADQSQIQGVPQGLSEIPINQPISAPSAQPVQGVPAGLIEEPLNLRPGPPDSPLDELKRQSEHTLPEFAAGIGKGALKTAVGVGKLANDHIIPGGPVSRTAEDILNRGAKFAEPSNMAQGAGNIMEEGLEWTALEGPVKAGLQSLAKVSRHAPEILQLIEDYPTASKTILGLLKPAATGAAVGGAQGAVKGAAEDDVAGGAASGAVGGALGSVAAELGIKLATKGGKLIGIGRDSLEEATRAAKPNKNDVMWEQNWKDAAPELAARYKDVKGQGVEGVADTALKAADDLWTGKVIPMIADHKTDLKDVLPVAEAIRGTATKPGIITRSLAKLSPARAKAAEEFANLYAGPGKQNQMMSIQEIEEDIEHLNSDLRDSDWWKKSAPDRAAAVKAGTEDGVKSVAADALRDVIYDHIESFPGNNIRELKRTYGALRAVEHDFRGQVNVQGRQAFISLKKFLAMTAAATAGAGAHGGAGAAVGAVAGAAPAVIDHYVNSADAMAERAVRMARPETAGVAAVKNLGRRVAQAAGGVSGERTAKWIHFQGEDGQTYLGHPEDWDKILLADPKAKKVE